jgi:Na+/H+ antiporter NhaC
MAATFRLHLLLPLFAATTLAADEPRFHVETPPVVLTDVPVSFVRITVHREGNHFPRFEDRPTIEGIRLTVDGRDAALPAFTGGVLELKTDLEARRKVYVAADRVVIAPNTSQETAVDVPRIGRWWSIVPPIFAVLLAVWLRNVLVALFAGVWSGAAILAHGNPLAGFFRALDDYVIGQLAGDETHLMIVLFTLFLGAMIGVMARSGGTLALVARLAHFTRTRERGQLLTWFLGLVVFFDDYANTLLLGSTMRPVTDRLRISREKLAFLVDSTAAPVAGLAVVSTWVGVEIGYIADTFERLGLKTDDVYLTFLATVPYRFYPLYLLAFVWLVAYSGRDFGPMLRAEARAAGGQLWRPGAVVPAAESETSAADGSGQPLLLRHALVPVGALLLFILVGFWWSGSAGLSAANAELRAAGRTALSASVWSILKHADSNRVLLFSSFAASVAAIVSVRLSRTLSLAECTEAWLEGAKSMFLAVVILVLAWGIAAVCDADHLNTAGFLVELTRGNLAVEWMPSLAFVLAAAVSFATGSSWSTMGLLMPLFISITYYLLIDASAADPNHPLMLGTIGAVLAGAIFGDHCSPISDTTVLSSAASGCDHLDHVTTQMPYALAVAGVSLVLGYVVIGFGFSPLIILPLGLVALYMLVMFWGRPVEGGGSKIEDRK